MLDENKETVRPEIELILALSRLKFEAGTIERCRDIIRDNDATIDWGYFFDQSGRNKVLPLVSHNIISHRLFYNEEGISAIPYFHVYAAIYAGNVRRNALCADEFGGVIARLNAAGVPYCVRKGPVLVDAYYKDYGLRWIGDLDILVDKRDLEKVGEVLRSQGYQQGRVTPDGKGIKPFKRSTEIFWSMHLNNAPPYMKPATSLEVEGGFQVDLCHDIFQRRLGGGGSVSTADLLSRRIEMRLYGQPSYALAVDDQFLDLCMHFHKEATARYYIESHNSLQLRKLLDIAESCKEVMRRGGWDGIVARARTCNMLNSLYYALHYTSLVYPEAVPPQVVAEIKPEDCSFIDEYGAVDGKTALWDQGPLARMFGQQHVNRGDVRGTVPRI
ncbi:nucleotidyltransferase family protein [Nonomuraea sp. NPDC049129]|uniref:nucleotidyltransferase domain-containing protein n=1 Tax=Nonomuraea sp. NPDC049129 TaxID=3155272 RepID=UPI003402D0E9